MIWCPERTGTPSKKFSNIVVVFVTDVTRIKCKKEVINKTKNTENIYKIIIKIRGPLCAESAPQILDCLTTQQI